MRIDDFFSDDGDVVGYRALREELLRALRPGPLPGHDDVEVAATLARLIHQDLESYGTGGGEAMNPEGIRLAILSLRAVVDRLGVGGFDLPFRDYASFRTWWVQKDAHGSWQARRDLLEGLFGGLHSTLEELEQRSLASSLVDPISPRGHTGWAAVDVEVTELRRHFLNARTAQDYRNVGNDCVSVTEALSREVYVSERHLRSGEAEPPVSSTKIRLERVVEDAAPGPDSAAIRKMARAAIELAQHVKHSTTPTRRDAGIAADAVIQLANILRRLQAVE